MAKQSAIEQDGTIVEALSNAMFRIQLENGHEITGHQRNVPHPAGERTRDYRSYFR